MADFEVKSSATGPMFDGRAIQAVQDFQQASEKAIAQEGEMMVHTRLHQVLKHPTGYYEAHVKVGAHGKAFQIDDSGVVYGPWLEGTSSRNETTSFAGYGTFRLVTQSLDREAEGIAERTLPPYMRRME